MGWLGDLLFGKAELQVEETGKTNWLGEPVGPVNWWGDEGQQKMNSEEGWW